MFKIHALEKILARAAKKECVKANEIVNVDVDFVGINDLYLQTLRSFEDFGGKKVWDRRRAAFIFDHYAPAPTIKTAKIQQEMREFAKKNELKYHFDTNAGICHQVLVEAGLVYPGMILGITDSHSTTHGALGAFGTGFGASDMASILISGKIWLKVPEIIEIRIEGSNQEGVYPKDVILNILGSIKSDGAVYKAIEFTGTYVENLDLVARMVLCNMAVEMGAKTAYIQPNDKVIEYVSKRAVREYTIETTDPDYNYAEQYYFELDNLMPQVALPHSVDKVSDIDKLDRIRIDQGFIGSCTGGRTEDIAVAASILRGKSLPRDVRLIVIPASSKVLLECINRGYIQELIDAGATISTPGCGPCLGVHQGILASDEVCITASNRNFPGRMGSTGASIYLASPATVAASVLTGKITDPRTLMGGN